MQHSLPLPMPEPLELETEAGGCRQGAPGQGPGLDRLGEIRADAGAEQVAAGVARLLRDLGYRTLMELRLANGRRADVVGLDRRGRFVIVEVKSTLADFRADQKWPDYLPFSDNFYFGVPRDFPLNILPEAHGVVVADAFAGAILRRSRRRPMAPAIRSRQILLFGLTACARLNRDGGPRPDGAF